MSTYSLSDETAVGAGQSSGSASRKQELGNWLRTSGAGVAARGVRHRRRGASWNIQRRLSRQRRLGFAPPCAVAPGARAVPDAVGNCDCKIRVVSIAVLPAASGHHRGLYRRSAEIARQRLRLDKTPARRIRRWSRLGIPDGGIDRLVARRRLRRGFRLPSSLFPRVGAPAPSSLRWRQVFR